MTGALCLDAWEKLLPSDDPDWEFILQGVREGFRLTTDSYEGPPVVQRNYRSATCKEHFDLVEEQILTEINNGRYEVCERAPHLVSALGAIPKPGKNKIRLIHDCSRPEGRALNDFASSESYSYQTLHDAVSLIQPGDYVAKIDLSNAYKSVKIHPSEYHLTGLHWTFKNDEEKTYLRDTHLPYGARLSANIFNRLTQAVRRILTGKREGSWLPIWMIFYWWLEVLKIVGSLCCGWLDF